MLGNSLSNEETRRLLFEVQSISAYFRGFMEDIDMLADALSVTSFEMDETILQVCAVPEHPVRDSRSAC